jgi:hypothetical protein
MSSAFQYTNAPNLHIINHKKCGVGRNLELGTMGSAKELACKGETLGIFWRSIHSTICSDSENFSDTSDRKISQL